MLLAAEKLALVVGSAQRRTAVGLRYVAIASALATPGGPQEAAWRSTFGSVLLELGRYAEAESEYGRALDFWKTENGPDHPNVAKLRNNLANALHSQGKYAEAEAQHRQALLQHILRQVRSIGGVDAGGTAGEDKAPWLQGQHIPNAWFYGDMRHPSPTPSVFIL